MARKLTLMSVRSGDVWAVVTMDDAGKVKLTGKDTALEDIRVIRGKSGQLRPRDGKAYFDELKKMFERSSSTVGFEPHEETEALRYVAALSGRKPLPSRSDLLEVPEQG